MSAFQVISNLLPGNEAFRSSRDRANELRFPFSYLLLNRLTRRTRGN